MTQYYFVIAILLSAIGFASIRCLVLFNILDKASKLIFGLLLATFVTEALAFIGVVFFKYNIVIYNIFSAVQFVLLTLYYYEVSSVLKKGRRIFYFISIGLAVFIINIFLQDFLTKPNTIFLAFESVYIVLLALIFFHDLLNNKQSISKTLSHHFWINAILLTFWSFTLFDWLVGLTIYESLGETAIMLNYLMWFINIITYTGFGLVFLFYKKLQPVE